MDQSPGNAPGGTGASDVAGAVADQVRSGAQQAVQQTQQAAQQVTEQAKQKATSLLESQKDRLSENMTTVAQALRQTSQNLREQNQTPVGDVIDTAAERVERVSNYLKSHHMNELGWELENYGRRSPAVLLGGAFALGFLASRFFKSSAPQRNMEFEGSPGFYEDRYPSGYSYGYESVRSTSYANEDYGRGMMTPEMEDSAPGYGIGPAGLEIGATEAEVTTRNPEVQS